MNYLPVLAVWLLCCVGVGWSLHRLRAATKLRHCLWLMLLPPLLYSQVHQLDLYAADSKLRRIAGQDSQSAKERLGILKTLGEERLQTPYLQQIHATLCLNAGELQCTIDITNAMDTTGTLNGELAVLRAEALYLTSSDPQDVIDALARAEQLQPLNFSELATATRLAQNLGLAARERWLTRARNTARAPLHKARLAQLVQSQSARAVVDDTSLEIQVLPPVPVQDNEVSHVLTASLHILNGPKLPLAAHSLELPQDQQDQSLRLTLAASQALLPAFNLRTALARRENLYLRIAIAPQEETGRAENSWCLNVPATLPQSVEVQLTDPPQAPLRNCE